MIMAFRDQFQRIADGEFARFESDRRDAPPPPPAEPPTPAPGLEDVAGGLATRRAGMPRMGQGRPQPPRERGGSGSDDAG
jgi:hypothetical protein